MPGPYNMEVFLRFSRRVKPGEDREEYKATERGEGGGREKLEK